MRSSDIHLDESGRKEVEKLRVQLRLKFIKTATSLLAQRGSNPLALANHCAVSLSGRHLDEGIVLVVVGLHVVVAHCRPLLAEQPRGLGGARP